MVDNANINTNNTNQITHLTNDVGKQVEYNNFSEGNYANTNYFNQNPDRNIEKDNINYILNENKHLKNSNSKLVEKLKELERKIKIANMQLEDVFLKIHIF